MLIAFPARRPRGPTRFEILFTAAALGPAC